MVDIKEAATRKLGPLPVWAWGAVVGGGLLIYRVATGGGASDGASSPFVQPVGGNVDYDDLGGGGIVGGGGGGGTTTPTPTTPSPTTGGGAPRRSPGGNRRHDGLPLIAVPGSRAGGGQRIPAAAGDTADAPSWPGAPIFGALGGSVPVLGLPEARAAAVTATSAMLAQRELQPMPSVPSYPIAVPGTLVPKSVPLIAAQGDDARVTLVSFLDPRGWSTAARARVMASVPPTTRAVFRPARAIDAARERFTRYTTG